MCSAPTTGTHMCVGYSVSVTSIKRNQAGRYNKQLKRSCYQGLDQATAAGIHSRTKHSEQQQQFTLAELSLWMCASAPVNVFAD